MVQLHGVEFISKGLCFDITILYFPSYGGNIYFICDVSCKYFDSGDQHSPFPSWVLLLIELSISRL